MAIQMDGKQGDQGNLAALTKLYKDQTVYLGWATAPLIDTSTLATITESTGVTRTDISSNLGTPALDGGIPKLKNSSQITTANATAAESMQAWFVTDVASGTTGNILAYGNYDTNTLNTNVGSPITVAIDGLVLQND